MNITFLNEGKISLDTSMVSLTIVSSIGVCYTIYIVRSTAYPNHAIMIEIISSFE